MKQLNKVVVLMTMMVVIVSCKMNVFDIITDNDFKYWYRYNALDRLEGSPCIYYFDNQNKWKLFEIVPNIGFREYNGGDDLISDKWCLVNDSIIEIDGICQKIITTRIRRNCHGFQSGQSGLVPAKPRQTGGHCQSAGHYAR